MDVRLTKYEREKYTYYSRILADIRTAWADIKPLTHGDLKIGCIDESKEYDNDTEQTE